MMCLKLKEMRLVFFCTTVTVKAHFATQEWNPDLFKKTKQEKKKQVSPSLRGQKMSGDFRDL